MNSTDLAKDLITLAGGPSIFGVAAVLGFLVSTLGKPQRDPWRGWHLLGGETLLLAWLVMFLIIAGPTVLESWTAKGSLNPTLVLLSATWILTIVLTIVLVGHAKTVATYLTESYPSGEGPPLIRFFRRLLK